MSCAAVIRRGKTLAYVLAAMVLSAWVVSWFVWGPFGVFSFAAGRLNSKLAFIAIVCSLLWLPPVATVCLFSAVGYAVWRRHRLTRRETWFALILIAVTSAFIASFFAGIISRRLGVFSMFMRGFAGYVDHRADVETIQGWLNTLDPNDCQGQVLEDETWPGVDPARSRRAIPVPPSVAHLKPSSTRLYRDVTGRPTVRLAWGSSHLGWGLVVATEDTTISEAHEAQPKEQEARSYETREPFAPGAYIWVRME